MNGKEEESGRASGWIPVGGGRDGKLDRAVSHDGSVPRRSRRAAGATTGPLAGGIAGRWRNMSRG